MSDRRAAQRTASENWGFILPATRQQQCRCCLSVASHDPWPQRKTRGQALSHRRTTYQYLTSSCTIPSLPSCARPIAMREKVINNSLTSPVVYASVLTLIVWWLLPPLFLFDFTASLQHTLPRQWRNRMSQWHRLPEQSSTHGTVTLVLVTLATNNCNHMRFSKRLLSV